MRLTDSCWVSTLPPLKVTIVLRAPPSGEQVTIVRAGRVVTMGDPPDVDGFVVRDGIVVDIGDAGELRARHAGASVIDLGGDSTVVPGFHDAHLHPEIVAENALAVDVSPAAVLAAGGMGELLKQQCISLPPGTWVTGSGLSLSMEHVSSSLGRRELDRLCPDHPVYLTHVSCHWGVGNTRALASLGDAGPKSGLLTEDDHFRFAFPAMSRAPVRLPRPNQEVLDAELARLFTSYVAAGVTAAVDALAWPGSIRAYRRLLDSGRLPVRLGLLLSYPHLGSLSEVRELVGSAEGHLDLVGVKLFADGALSGGTCYLDEPYEGATEDRGELTIEPMELIHRMREALAAGLSPSVHANGDAAVAMVLDAVAAVRRNSASPLPIRIEHCSLVRPADVDRIRRLNVIPVLFGGFIARHGDELLRLYGANRADRLIPARSMCEAGVVCAASSDAPAGPFGPLLGIQDLVQRTAPSGRQVGAVQAVNISTALRLYTVGGAVSVGRGGSAGALLPGHVADFVQLDVHPERIEEVALAEVGVRATWVAGRRVWVDDGGAYHAPRR